MRRLLVTTLCAALALPTLAAAHDYDRPRSPPAYQHPGWAPPPHPGRPGDRPIYVYRAYPGYYNAPAYGGYYHRHKHHGDNDDAWWALGGLVAGVIVGTAIDNSYAPPPVPPPPHR